jgi:phosphoserine aminotransferase
MKQHNFSPGPAALPESVLQEAAQGLLNYNQTGLSVAEISHRSPIFLAIIEEATALVKELYQLDDRFEVLWMPGGASGQLAIAPLNLVSKNERVAFVDTGFWAQRAIDAAAEICQIHVLASSSKSTYDHIPKDWTLPNDIKYLHVVSNETIDGTQYHSYPDVAVPLVADMTSDFLTRPLPMEKFGVIFASAQKNFGIAGVTCVILNKDRISEKMMGEIPTIYNYQTHIREQSLYHTIPTFPVYVSLLMLRWMKVQGGLKAMQAQSIAKSSLLYAEIDRHPLFKGNVHVEDRSVMNACFRGINAEVEEAFLAYLTQHGIVGIKGFPTVGGFRASMYNGLALESVQYLVDLMHSFK